MKNLLQMTNQKREFGFEYFASHDVFWVGWPDVF
jgi:hypothetical protein